jgi:hypothetical protein
MLSCGKLMRGRGTPTYLLRHIIQRTRYLNNVGKSQPVQRSGPDHCSGGGTTRPPPATPTTPTAAHPGHRRRNQPQSVCQRVKRPGRVGRRTELPRLSVCV